jgi:hypothetical protein
MQMAIITSYVPGAAYGLLGPQIAATIIQDHTRHPCIVIAVTRDDDKDSLKEALSDYFGPRRPVIGFSALSGREDLFSLAKELKDEGAVTILAGPQADADFRGKERSPLTSSMNTPFRDLRICKDRRTGAASGFSKSISPSGRTGSSQELPIRKKRCVRPGRWGFTCC